MSKNLLSPVGVAVHTRGVKRGEDYGWYVKAGDTQLFEPMEEIHRLVLRDVGGKTPKLAVLLKQDRLGFLIGNMPSQRWDHAPRIINDTLYLEFNQEYDCVLEAVANLLVCSADEYKKYEQDLTNYAERLYDNSSVEKFDEIEWASGKNLPSPIKPDKLALALPYNDNSCKRCGGYLIEAAIRGVSSFCFVSTGGVSLEKCQQLANKMSVGCVILTESSEVGEEIDLKKRDLRRLLSTPLRKILTRLSQLSDMSLSLLSIGLGCLVVILVLRATTVNVQDVDGKKSSQTIQQLNMPFNGEVCLSYDEQYRRCVNYILKIGSDKTLSLDRMNKCLLFMLSYQAQGLN
jgi:hypothetical protein